MAIKATKQKRNNFGSMPVLTKHFEQQNFQINENGEKIQDRQIYSSTSNNVFDYHPEKNLTGFTFSSQDNVVEQDIETNLLTVVPGAFMHSETIFMFDFNTVTCKHLILINLIFNIFCALN